ncbi:MAG: GntR family transcriptional regulator [Ilumatobacteraceae bacterium]
MEARATRPPNVKLSDHVADQLRARLEQGEWQVNEKLPSENELTEQFGVSRATIRTALHALDRQGLTVTVHGVGTFATAAGQVVAADLQRLESISETIVRMGRVPSSTFRSISIRESTEAESTALGIEAAAPVLFVQREILADGEIVAYSHDAIPLAVLGADFDVRSVDGSLFVLLDDHGVDVRSSLTNIHASRGDDVGWGTDRDGELYVLLEQAHFDRGNRGVAFSRTWFIEGRFQFSIVRVG